MWIGRIFYKLRRRLSKKINLIFAGRRQEVQQRSRLRYGTGRREGLPGLNSKIIWTTLITSKRRDEVEIAASNLENLKPVLLWAGLAIDGTSNDIRDFIARDYPPGFDNILWLTQPRVVSRSGYYAGKMGHFNRISLNFLRSWICNMETGEENGYLFCHTDGDWAVTIRPESIEPLCVFFHTHPEVVALSRILNPGLIEFPNMWPDRELDGAVWYGKALLSTNVIIAPLDRIKPLVLEALKRFPDHRPDILENVLGGLAAENDLVTAYPTREYYSTHFHIDLEETQAPFSRTGPE